MKYGKLWYSVELTKDKADIFKEYLHNNGIRFEPSECYNLIHFECYMTPDKLGSADEFLEGLYYKDGKLKEED